jgi:hypothetical protein
MSGIDFEEATCPWAEKEEQDNPQTERIEHVFHASRASFVRIKHSAVYRIWGVIPYPKQQSQADYPCFIQNGYQEGYGSYVTQSSLTFPFRA